MKLESRETIYQLKSLKQMNQFLRLGWSCSLMLQMTSYQGPEHTHPDTVKMVQAAADISGPFT